VAVVGRANVGKSTLVNAMVGEKVSIVSDKPQTTRAPARAVLARHGAEVVLVDTPGLHKPRTLLSQQLNRSALGAMEGVDAVVLVVDARAGVGRGDSFVAERLPKSAVCALNKIDSLPRSVVFTQLRAAGDLGLAEYFPVSARTGAGVEALLAGVVARLPEGPRLYPPGTTREMPEPEWVAELVREQLLALTREELPYSIACRVTDWEWPYVRCEVLVERESQKGMVIGRGGSLLKQVGTKVRAQMPAGAYLELSVRVAHDWQRRPEALEQLGY
jgi:GTP-binding protein Era